MISRLQRLAPALILVLLCGPGAGSTFSESEKEDAANLEYQVKAGFVFNFLKFVSWPDDSILAPNSWKIGVLGDRSVFKTMRDTLSGKTIDDRPVEVIKLKTDEDVIGCHVMFVMDDFDTETWAKFGELKHTPILIVGESKDFAKRHGIIGFVERKGSIRLQINPSRAKNASLVISGKLARIAEVVKDAN